MNDRRQLLQTLMAAALVSRSTSAQSNGSRLVQRQPLPPPFDSMDAAIVEVTIPPGKGTPVHRHSGFVLGYVLEGEFQFGVKGEPARTLKAGDAFYEPPDAIHTVSASALPDRPARILAIVIGEKGRQLTTFQD